MPVTEPTAETNFYPVNLDSSLQTVPSRFNAIMRTRSRLRCGVYGMFAVLLSSLLSVNNVASAAEPAIQIENVQLGLGGVFKVGRWTSVEFDLTGPEGQTVLPVLRAADPDGRPTQQPLTPVTLSPNSQRISGLIRSGRLDGAIQIQIFEQGEAGKLLSETPVKQMSLRIGTNGKWKSLRQTSQLWVTIGKQPMLEKGFERWNLGRSEFVRLVELSDAEANFSQSQALDSVDALVLNGDVVLTEQAAFAIRDWVKHGGRLILSVGDTGSSLSESPLATWLPALPSGRLDVTKLTGFNDLVPRSSTLRTLATLPAARFDRNIGTVIASGLADPLAIRAAYGSGFVTFVAIRLDALPLVNWEAESQVQLVSKLASLPNPAEISAATTARSEAASELNPSAVTDLQIQLNHSLDHFTEINRPSHWQVMGWIALFAFVIGPLDYYFVSYVLKRPEWTWGTLVIWSVLGAFLATSWGNQQNQKPAVARQFDIIDLDSATNSAFVRSWYGFYSEQTQRVKVEARPNPSAIGTGLNSPQLRAGWINRPSEGFRGMYRSGGINDTSPAYQFSADQSAIENLPVEIWSSGDIQTEWTAAGKSASLIQSDLHVTGINRLAGTIEHQLPGELTDWFIAYGNFAYFDRSAPGSLPAPLVSGKTWDLASSGSNLLRGRLLGLLETGTAQSDRVNSDGEMSRLSYDATNTDPFRIGITASFYKLLGGEEYTGIQNQSLGQLDLTPILDLNRAILFGRMKAAPTEITVDGKTLPSEDHTTLIRMFLPVKVTERSSDAPPTRDILEFKR